MRISRIAAGLLLGAMMGAAVALLFVPRSWADTQQLIRDRVHAVLDEGRRTAEARRRELRAQFEASKQSVPRS